MEIAYDDPDDGNPRHARLFALSELDEAADFAIGRNLAGCNVYVGAALRLESALRTKRCSGDDFYVATAVPVDIDRDYDATRARMAAVCGDGLVVTTGLTPERRSQHWVRLDEPCDDLEEFAGAFSSLVHHIGADAKVKDGARLMRLGGTLSFPKSKRKIDAGYLTELTAVTVNGNARAANIEALARLAPVDGEPSPGREPGEARPGEIIRDSTGRVTDGRESYWRNLVLAQIGNFQAAHRADPTEEDIWELAYPIFFGRCARR